MREFIDKLISKLEEIYNRNDKVKKKAYEEQDWEHFDIFTHRNEGVYTSISTVHQLAEEYNNGWIPCSERLPEENTEVIVTVREIEGSRYTQTSWMQEGQWVVKKTPLMPEVIAWQPLPVPFKKAGGEDE